MEYWKLIVIEGIDATGKTTLAQSLSEHCNGVYYKTPWWVSLEERSKYDSISITPTERYNFYLNACKKDILKILELQEAGKNVFCDRLLDSTIISHKILDPSIDTQCAEVLSKSIQKTQILLIAPIDIILTRIAERKNITRFEKDVSFLRKMQNHFLERQNDLVIDVWNMSKYDVLHKTYQYLTQNEE